MPALNIRRANVDDLPALQALWVAARLPADELECRLTEFQVVEADGQFAGAIGLQILRQHARLHSEDFCDFAVADAARELIWERVQKIAANHGVFRLWSQETSPFWTRWGFQPPNAEQLERLPAEWRSLEGRWLTLELKNEDAINDALNNQLPGFLESERKQTELTAERAKKFRTFVTVLFFTIGIISFAFGIWMLMHRSLTPR